MTPDIHNSNLMKCFVTRELMRWPSIESVYGPTLQGTDVFEEKTLAGRKRWEDLHTRVIEHVCHSYVSFI